MSNFINEKAFGEFLGKHLHDEMLKAAEPIIQRAKQDAEQAMRQRLAEMVVGYLRDSYSIDRMGHDLRIIVHLNEPNKNERPR